MCGFVGLVGNEPQRQSMAAMLAAIRVRGPDDEQFVEAKWFGLAVCRLSIVALESGRQPVSDARHGVWLAFNGEIYDYKAIRDRLHDVEIPVASEAEALLRLYLLHGPTFADELDGDFAIAVFDSRTNSCHLFRDRVGVKPLFYALLDDGRTWVFASHVRAFFRNPRFSTGLDRVTLAERRVLRFWSSDRTLFDRVRQVRPGHSLELRSSGVKEEAPQALVRPFNPIANSISAEPGEKIDVCSHRLLRRAFARRVEHTEVNPIVLALSGGVDCILLATLAAEEWRDRVVTLTVFDDAKSHDRHYASLLARELGLRHEEWELTPGHFLGKYPQLLAEVASPNPHYTPYFLGAASRILFPSAKVLLCGEGADEMFWGYPFHADPQGFLAPRFRALEQVELALVEQSDLLRHVRGWTTVPADTAWHRLAELFEQDQLVNLHLLPFDHGPMAHGVECRVPYLDRAVVHFAKALSPDIKVLDGTPKILLRLALASALQHHPLLARELLLRPKSPAFFSARRCQDCLGQYLDDPSISDRLTRHPLAQYAHGLTDLFWLAGTAAVFFKFRGEVDGLTMPELLSAILEDVVPGK